LGRIFSKLQLHKVLITLDDDDVFLSADTKSIVQIHIFCTTQVDKNVQLQLQKIV